MGVPKAGPEMALEGGASMSTLTEVSHT